MEERTDFEKLALDRLATGAAVWTCSQENGLVPGVVEYGNTGLKGMGT